MISFGIGVRRAFATSTKSLFRTKMATTKVDGLSIRFGPFTVTDQVIPSRHPMTFVSLLFRAPAADDEHDQVFLKTEHSFALVNLKPLIPGHILICPLTPYQRLTDLNAPETADLFNTVQLAQRLLSKLYFPAPAENDTAPPRGVLGGEASDPVPTGSFSVAIQDGPEAGQTVPHVHVHVIPRTKGDLPRPDDVYAGMASEEGNVGGALWDRGMRERPVPGGGMPRIEDEDRSARTAEDMNEEAERYRVELRAMGVE